MRVLLSTVLLFQIVVANQDILCCKRASGFKRCRSACNEYVAQTYVRKRFAQLKELPKHCPGYLTDFWSCLNRSNSVDQYVDSKMANHAGICCLLTSLPHCRQDCLKGKLLALNKSCPQASDQHAHLHSCIDRHQETAKCCRSASKDCVKACKVIFSSEKPPKMSAKKRVREQCAIGGQHVINCVENSVPTGCPKGKSDCESQSGEQLRCCDLAGEEQCKKGCKRVLLKMDNAKESMEGLTNACKEPLQEKANQKMWNCLLSPVVRDPTPLPITGIDGAKLQCCSKALSSLCWRLCITMFTSSWDGSQNYQQFDRQCTYNPKEANLMNCIADVTKPCQLGCSGLNFCTNFNNRHTELFRSCDAKSDSHAKYHMQDWEKGIINMPGMPIPVQDIKTCLPDTWKTIACVLQIKPCSIKSHRSTICRADCIRILNQCGNATLMHQQPPEEVCNKLSPMVDQSSCISIGKYLRPSPYSDVTDQVTHPCNPNPCQKSRICEINRTCYAASLDGCERHTCYPGCRLGEASTFLVRMGEYAKVPVESGQDGCFRVCHCGSDGKLSRCTNLECVYKRTCAVKGLQKPKEHGERFAIGRNFCACFAGELMCTRKTIQQGLSMEFISTNDSLPCGCPATHDPVCARDGRTYPNACIARCSGLKPNQYSEGNCASIDPCKDNPCDKGQRCIIARKSCISTNEPCVQYFCVAASSYCKDMQLEPVCDTDGQQHPNLCSLHFQGKKLAYKGFCKSYCKSPTKPVCGVNGETYSSICGAHSARVVVDYEGPCRAIGYGQVKEDTSRCANVECPKRVPGNCKGVHPPGACCMQCAAQLRVLVSQTQLTINSQGFRNYGPITLEHLLVALRRHVTTSECDLFGYQSIEGDVVVLIMAVTLKPTMLQIEACSLEAQKIEASINTESPSFTSDVLLSTLKGAQTDTPSLSAMTQASSTSSIKFIHLLGALLHTYFITNLVLSS
ncbi:reversion-inducing cysteine-rich protein with Kazal motifs isoform X2 [Nematostella vectensis]|uniref:reversion-inducing cysteine-rich protein with Kazal motifs isoform X2 n=1 Tax=Nematostella vectensis TaxID=45351 RepID=UPI0020779963|nr:reversion-inducing cysteine-rich protein with Kazal motifs isoform X2 [Nematostella vectensis]